MDSEDERLSDRDQTDGPSSSGGDATKGGRGVRAGRFFGSYNENEFFRMMSGEEGRNREPSKTYDASKIDKLLSRKLRPGSQPMSAALLHTFYTYDHIREILFLGVPWLPVQQEADKFWLHPAGTNLMKDLYEMLSQPWHDVSGGGPAAGSMEVLEFGDRTSLDTWRADGAAPASRYRPFGRGLSQSEVDQTIGWIKACRDLHAQSYLIDDFEKARARLADCLYQLAIGEYAPRTCTRIPVPSFQLTAEMKTELRRLIFEQAEVKQLTRLDRRLEDVVTILLQMGDRTAQEHGLEKRVIHALTFLAQDQELKELMLDDIVHLVDAILTEHEDVLGTDREPSADGLPRGRPLQEMFIVERRKPRSAGRAPLRESERLLADAKAERTLHVRLGDRVLMRHEAEDGSARGGDQGRAHLWMGRVTRIHMNARGRIMFKLLWDYAFLDQAEYLKNTSSGRTKLQMLDIRSQLQEDPVISRIYFQGSPENQAKTHLSTWQAVVHGMKVLVPEREDVRPELQDWEVRLRMLSPADLAHGFPAAVEEELAESHKLGPGKGVYALAGTFQKYRFQSFFFDRTKEEQAAAAAERDEEGVIVMNVLEPCCGCGGLSSFATTYDLGEGGKGGPKVVIKAKWGVDIDAGAAQSFAVNHPGCSAYNMRFDEFMFLVQHRELLTRHLLQEGAGKGAGKGDENDTHAAEKSAEKLAYRVDQIRLYKNLDSKAPEASRRCSGHPLEPDRGNKDLPELQALQDELQSELGASDANDGAYTYDPAAFKFSWLEFDLTAKKADGSFARETVQLNSKEALKRWKSVLLPFLQSDRLPRIGQVDPATRVDIIASGPPCQNLTGLVYAQKCRVYNSAKKTMGTLKNEVLLQVLDGVGTFRPRFVVIENVLGSLQTLQGIYQLTARALLHKHGYQYRTAILNASRYQVPQDRRRVILLGARADAILPSFPRPLNRDPLTRQLHRKVSANSELEHLDQMTINATDLDVNDLNNAPVVVGDVMGRLQDLSMGAGGGPAEAYRSAPRTPLQHVLRRCDPAAVALSYKVGDGTRYFSDNVRSISLLNANSKTFGSVEGGGARKAARRRGVRAKDAEDAEEVVEVEEEALEGALDADPEGEADAIVEVSSGSEAEAEAQVVTAAAAGASKDKKRRLPGTRKPRGQRDRTTSKAGNINPADYTVSYPTTYYWTPEIIDELAPPPGYSEEGAPAENGARPSAKANGGGGKRHTEAAYNHGRLLLLTEAPMRPGTRDLIKSRLHHIMRYGLESTGAADLREAEILSSSTSPVANLLHPLGISPTTTMEKIFAMIHPNPEPDPDAGNMRLASERELARLQTFPDSMLLRAVGSTDRTKRYCVLHQIANAVPVHMAKALGVCIAFAAAGLTPSTQELLRVTEHVPGVSEGLREAQRTGAVGYLEEVKGRQWRTFLDANAALLDRIIREDAGLIVPVAREKEKEDEDEEGESGNDGMTEEPAEGAGGPGAEAGGGRGVNKRPRDSKRLAAKAKKQKLPIGVNPPSHRLITGDEALAALGQRGGFLKGGPGRGEAEKILPKMRAGVRSSARVRAMSRAPPESDSDGILDIIVEDNSN